MCDGFCNEDSLMWRRSRVTRVLSWARGKKCKAGKTTVSHFLPPNQFQPSRMDLSGFVQFNFYFPALFWFSVSIYLISTSLVYTQLCLHPLNTYFSAFHKPFVPLWLLSCQFIHFLQQTTKPKPVWAADRHVSTKDRGRKTPWFNALWRKKTGSMGREMGCSLIWWIFLTQTGNKVSAASADTVCVRPNKHIFSTSSGSVLGKKMQTKAKK